MRTAGCFFTIANWFRLTVGGYWDAHGCWHSPRSLEEPDRLQIQSFFIAEDEVLACGCLLWFPLLICYPSSSLWLPNRVLDGGTALCALMGGWLLAFILSLSLLVWWFACSSRASEYSQVYLFVWMEFLTEKSSSSLVSESCLRLHCSFGVHDSSQLHPTHVCPRRMPP